MPSRQLERLGLLTLVALLLTASPVVLGASARGSTATGPAAGPSAVAPGADAWPVYMHDPLRSGINPNDSRIGPSNVSRLHRAWNFSTMGSVVAEPAVVGDRVYVGSWDGYEYALNASTGARIWATDLGTVTNPRCYNLTQGVTSSASVVNGTVYVGGGSGWWYALNASNGSVDWKIFLGNTTQYYNWASPLILRGYAYIGISSACDNPLIRGALEMVSLSTHKVVHTLWTVPSGKRGASIWGSPTFDPSSNSVFVTTGNAYNESSPLSEAVLSVNATTLALQGHWKVPLNSTGHKDSDFGVTPTLFEAPAGPNGTPARPLVGAANKNGVFYALNRSNLGAGPLWAFRIAKVGACPECGDGSIVSAVFNGSALFVAGGNTVVGTTKYLGSVAALDPATGAVIWQRGLDGIVIPALSYVNGLVFAGAGYREDVLDASNGSVLYSYVTARPVYGGSAIVGSCVFFGSTSGEVYGLALSGTTCGKGPTAPPPLAAGASPGPGAPAPAAAPPVAARPALPSISARAAR